MPNLWVGICLSLMMIFGFPQTSHAGLLSLKLEKVDKCVEQGPLSALTLISMSSRKQLSSLMMMQRSLCWPEKAIKE